jgi:endonuclease/exonuclease/phosphatase family metal-dependent hydrolase
MLTLRVATYNLLCPSYGLKWGEREACLDWKSPQVHGPSSWSARWPALLRVMQSAIWDVLVLQEIEPSTQPDIAAGIEALGLHLEPFKHPGRADGLAIAFDPDKFELESRCQRDYPRPPSQLYATSGRLDLRLRTGAGHAVRVVATHQKGGVAAQLADLGAFAEDEPPEGLVLTLVCGDFNEDFGVGVGVSPWPGYSTLDRVFGRSELSVSRPAHKQDPRNNRSGRGKVDYIFAKAGGAMTTCSLERDEASRRALLLSHAACDETGEWPSDHGMEALYVSLGHTCTSSSMC